MHYSVKQAASLAGKTEQTIRNWIKKGKLKTQKINGCWQVDPASLGQCQAVSPNQTKQEIAINHDAISQIVTGIVAQLRPAAQAGQAGQAEQKSVQERELEELRQKSKQQQERINALEKSIENLNNALSMLHQQGQQKPREQSQEKPKQGGQKPKEPSQSTYGTREQRAKKWARKNLSEWLDQQCPFGKAGGRSWRELAQNIGEKIAMNGKGEQSPRAYLHAIENWKSCNLWSRVKAKVALEVAKNGVNHYNRPEEIGG